MTGGGQIICLSAFVGARGEKATRHEGPSRKLSRIDHFAPNELNIEPKSSISMASGCFYDLQMRFFVRNIINNNRRCHFYSFSISLMVEAHQEI